MPARQANKRWERAGQGIAGFCWGWHRGGGWPMYAWQHSGERPNHLETRDDGSDGAWACSGATQRQHASSACVPLGGLERQMKTDGTNHRRGFKSTGAQAQGGGEDWGKGVGWGGGWGGEGERAKQGVRAPAGAQVWRGWGRSGAGWVGAVAVLCARTQCRPGQKGKCWQGPYLGELR